MYVCHIKCPHTLCWKLLHLLSAYYINVIHGVEILRVICKVFVLVKVHWLKQEMNWLSSKRHLLLWLIETSCNCLKRLQIICLSSSSCITKIPIKKISRRPGMQNFSNSTLNQWMGFWSRIKGKPTIVHNKMTHIPRDC